VKPDAALARAFDFIYGPCFRRIVPSPGAQTLYLTFDDGPDPRGTPRVLDLLDEFGVSATFFLIGERAKREPGLVREILARGHTLGNHSPDHRYATYFRGKKKLEAWVEAGERMIAEVAGVATVGFRPPAGIRTPELVRAVERRWPLILWQTRFYDSIFAPTADRLTRSLGEARSGDIVLFHDSQREANLELFLGALRAYLERARTLSYSFRSLERSHFHVEAPLP
jgi:peptidoglycan/xylan/chitin deacetylase (PgdA/CDA1 family)